LGYFNFVAQDNFTPDTTFYDDPPPPTAQWNTSTDLIIVTSHYREDLNWLKNSPYPVIVCTKEGADPSALSIEPKCKLPNKGREASAYLKFIIEFYDTLPQRVAFIHGHETAWHQNTNILEMIERVRKDLQYVSLNNMFYDNRNMDNTIYVFLKDMWEPHFKPYLNRDLPDRTFHDCCAQFVVTRNAIRSVRREAYAHWLALLMESEDLEEDYAMGMAFEYAWHIIFGLPDVLESPSTYLNDVLMC
jgi:hypothetical protein